MTWRDLAGSPPFQEAFERVASRAAKELSAAENAFTEAQFVEAVKQAVACGDFVKYCTVGKSAVVDGRFTYEHRQAVSYEPFREAERLKARIRELESQLAESEGRIANALL